MMAWGRFRCLRSDSPSCAETDGKLLRFLFIRERVVSGNEVLLHRLERRRDTLLRMVAECLGGGRRLC